MGRVTLLAVRSQTLEQGSSNATGLSQGDPPLYDNISIYTIAGNQEGNVLVLYGLSDLRQQQQGVTPSWEQGDAHERMGIEALQSQDCKLYKLLSSIGDADFVAPVILAVSLKVAQHDTNQLNTWYQEEHLGMMSRVPGWIRTRRYERVVDNGCAKTSVVLDVEYLTLYDFRAENGLQGEVHKEASATPRTAEIRGILKWKENQILYRQPGI